MANEIVSYKYARPNLYSILTFIKDGGDLVLLMIFWKQEPSLLFLKAFLVINNVALLIFEQLFCKIYLALILPTILSKFTLV